MDDHKSITWDDFYAARLPSGAVLLTEGGETAYALIGLRRAFQQSGAELLGSFMKWGLPVVKDLVAYTFFSECLHVSANTEQAMHTIRRPLDAVDWPYLERLFTEGAEKYKEHMRTVEKDGHKLKGFLDGLEYAMAGKLPGVEKPGDLHAAIMKSPDAN